MDHRTSAELTAHLDVLRAAPPQIGSLDLLVRRPATGEREILDQGVLDPSDGLVGDNWLSRATSHAIAAGRHLEAQINVMSSRMVRLLAPTAERQALAIGEDAVIEVTAKPHNGCKKFVARFGQDAMMFVNSPVGKDLRLRGFNAYVVSGGVVRPGDKAVRL